jgi:hypothetical protein
VAIGIEDKVIVSAATWPATAAVPPGDLSRYAPIGLGLPPPFVMQPWDDLSAVVGRGSFYGASDRTGDPLRDAPVNDPAGGVIYVDGRTEAGQLVPLLDLLGVNRRITGYAVFAAESADPVRDRYLAQIRIVDFGAMDLFGAVPDSADAPWTQALNAGELIAAFIEAQQTVWGVGMSPKLRGTLGGDGDWAKEALAFGFMVENGSNGVYRVWSRPWLVTK